MARAVEQPCTVMRATGRLGDDMGRVPPVRWGATYCVPTDARDDRAADRGGDGRVGTERTQGVVGASEGTD